MRILIIGASGLVGSHLFREGELRGHEIMGTYYQRATPQLYFLDATDKQTVKEIIKKFKPDVVLFPAAKPYVDYCQLNPEETWKINVDTVKNVLEEIVEREIFFVYFSSDYVFDGCCGPYSEEDVINPLSVYGKQKAECERIVRKMCPQHIIIRTTGVYGWEDEQKNFVASLIKRVNSGETVTAPVDQIGSPTYAADLARAVFELIKNKTTGTYNVSGPEVMNRYEFALLIASIFGLNQTLIKPVLTSKLNQNAPRPLKAGLLIAKLEKETGIKMLAPAEALKIMKREYEFFATKHYG